MRRLIVAMALTMIATSVTDACVQSQNQDLAPVLKGLLQEYQGCILERYETKDKAPQAQFAR
jgi:hypothetical protein